MLQLTSPLSSSILESTDPRRPASNPTNQITAQTVNATSTTPDLFAVFSKASILELLNVDNCTGIRLYPAIKENELVLIAGCVDANNTDIINTSDATCCCGYSTGANSHESTIEDSRNMILAKNDPDTIIKQNLRTLQNVGTSPKFFKAYFDASFLLHSDFESFSHIRFDVVELNFAENGITHRTIAASFPGDATMSIHASLLPCPPNCGSGGYLPDELTNNE